MSKRMISSLENPPIHALKDYYSILSIEKNASRQQIKDAFFRMKQIYSDNNQALYSIVNQEDLNYTLAEIDDAYRVLSHAEKRQEYDKSLIENGLAEPAEFSNYGSSGFSSPRTFFPPVAQWNNQEASEEMASPAEPFHAEGNFYGESHGIQSGHRRLQATSANDHSIQDKIAELIASHEPGDGNLFRKIRESCGLSLADMQEQIKVSIDYLENMEWNRFERLPQPVYVKGFLQSYLRFLGIKQPDKLITAYLTRFKDWMISTNH